MTTTNNIFNIALKCIYTIKGIVHSILNAILKCNILALSTNTEFSIIMDFSAKKKAKTFAAGALVAGSMLLPMQAKSATNVEITCTGGFTSTETNAFWNASVKNNTDIYPPGGPIISVTFSNLYSCAQPIDGGATPFWNMTPTQIGTSDFWNIKFDEDFSGWDYIEAGSPAKTFSFITYRPSTNHTVIVGTCYGKGLVDTIGYRPLDPGAPFQGPTGVIPPTYPPTLSASNFWLSALSEIINGSWDNGNGEKRIVVGSTNALSAFSFIPTDGINYSATNDWTQAIATNGVKVLLNGTNNTLQTINLSPGTEYFFGIFEYNGSGSHVKYLDAPTTGSATTLSPAPAGTMFRFR